MFFVINASEWQSSRHADRVWRHLWELRDVVPVSVVLPTVVSSPCSLLAEERADAVCSSTGMQVPQSSAWVPLQVDLSRFVSKNGDMRLQALERALIQCVDRGEATHETTAWASASLQSDSWLNRRLAVGIRGWGSVVQIRGDDPNSFATLSGLLELADLVGSTLEARSRALAQELGHCPALDVEGARIVQGSHEVRARWQRAVEASAIRHRNLLMMSPWDVFPASRPADLRYINLLPVLRCANSLSFQRDVDISHWKVNEFRGFYERVAAILGHAHGVGLIAKQV